ncbi:DNA internalization-related competence protein ComEC/Rec2 [Microbulbifer sp. TYP-18]|uniref:DNA internalization-related competence protein ComEC/Rec2 n=1 Tax=Microbulbifer sp. TYP-18 TaxID=3230024 RepID=UPI0034C66118
MNPTISRIGFDIERGWSLRCGQLLWCYAAGIVAAGSLPALPEIQLVLAMGLVLGIVALMLPWRRQILPVVLVFAAGFYWSVWHNQRALDQRLPPSQHGSDFTLSVRLVSLPGHHYGKAGAAPENGAQNPDLRFSARVLGMDVGGGQGLPPGALLDLTWYRAPHKVLSSMRAASVWRLTVRLKRPRGSVNPQGFDYGGWLLQRGVFATGYVRAGDKAPELMAAGSGLDDFRQRIRDRLWTRQLPRSDLLAALLLGDRSGVGQEDKMLLRHTGTAHLLAISGLHVGMVAGLFLALGTLLGRCFGLVTGRVAVAWPVGLALAAAVAYTLLAGAPLSAQRALVMTGVLLLGWCWRRRISAGLAYAAALAMVLTIQPLAFFSAGFWLSFLAVGALLLSFVGRWKISAAPAPDKTPWRLRETFFGLCRSQWVVGLSLLLPSLVYFSGFSFNGLLLNLVAIPWMGLSILPSIMAGTLLGDTAAGNVLLGFAGKQLQALMDLLSAGRDLWPGWWVMVAPHKGSALFLAAVAILLLLLPRGFPGRVMGWLVIVLLAAPLVPQLAAGVRDRDRFAVTVLDVGQGLAVVLRGGGNLLVYDAGPSTAGGWNSGSAIVAPHVVDAGFTAVDTVIISHGDNDHAGGAGGLAAELRLDRLVAPGALAHKLARQLGVGGSQCLAGRTERLGPVSIQWLWPRSAEISGEINDHSCVALAHWRGVRVLLAGDISAAAEREMVRRIPPPGPVDLLVAPHHGSRTSSSDGFIQWARPRNVVFSAGFRHHFGHPHPQVVTRYVQAGARVFNTADSGAVTFLWSDDSGLRVSEARDGGRFWYRDNELPRTD